MSCSVPWYRRAVSHSVKFGVLRRHSAEGPSGGHDTHVPVVIWDGGFVAQVVKLAREQQAPEMTPKPSPYSKRDAVSPTVLPAKPHYSVTFA